MVELVLRVVLSLGIVLGLMWFVARASSRKLGGRSRSVVAVVARQPLSRGSSLAVVEVGERVLVVGVSDGGVSLLTEMDPAELTSRVPVQPERATTDPADALGTRPVRALAGGPLHAAPRGTSGSLLAGTTWKQAWTAATSRNGSAGA